ncbi:hypothetical protein COCSUDRAFT_44507 [Coccomyxa subellipsoidea C-169]|uniref:Uncharacterized protein n=1 Tax=Coccomyxa subellipsoidea (strain C-169) TaxID=574566 RepID=I0YMN7_COCSC|nr:hypothetical protein COCSUDRAFT_44507 [Coccomyxa subellipsoidea C-169]EIE19656.1 hypothetical protein COCSUDRAFT_44507 [Coccomyxa subellipsoidea C-169]|eukprot:XP_005644200.1 hypothetical protein COCSUDRAFT_44507 [Coccomyxa subellipsoidea C-169]
MVLGLLIEAARDALTAMNSPEGDCIFCIDCFARWWRWEQRSLHAKRKQLIEELKAAAGPKLHDLGLVPYAQGLFTILCPSCRFKVGPDDLAKWMPRLVPRKGNAAEVQASEEQPASCHTVELPEADMARLRHMQQTHARLFAAQQQKDTCTTLSW